MDISSKIDSKKIKKLPSYLLSAFVIILVIVSLIITANNLMEYISIKQENQKLEIVRDNKLLEIDELKYYINTEIDDEYKERMARLLGYCFPDETIYYVE
ncbi:MAG: septum formation initiator family protein [Clostridia bacterium]|nr:septum formation initiator family protein [Clostridia bacterium]